MRQDDNTATPNPTSLQECPDCHERFVIPVDVLDVEEDGRCVVELHCTNCQQTRVSSHDETELMELDDRLEATTAAMHNAIDLLEAIDEWERVERFVEALHADLILPEDF